MNANGGHAGARPFKLVLAAGGGGEGAGRAVKATLPPRSVRTFTFTLPTKRMAMVEEEEVLVEEEGEA